MKDIKETFTSDLKYNNTIISLEDLEHEISDEDVIYPSAYSTEDLELIWRTLRKCYDLTDDHYIIMYLIYYLGFSYRKAGAVVGRVPSLVFLYEEQAIHAIKVFMGLEKVVETDPRDFLKRVKVYLDFDVVKFPSTPDELEPGKFTRKEREAYKLARKKTPEEIQEIFVRLNNCEEYETE